MNEFKDFPILYKKTSKGGTQFWSIKVSECSERERGVITTQYGLLGTDSPQVTHDIITTGKNVGKSNVTTPYQQACSEAQSRWEKKLNSGDVMSPEGAQSGEVDAIVEGGVLPMLAQTMEKAGKKLVYPLFVDFKYDGIRCIAIVKDGSATLWSRTRKLITSCPHIVKELADKFQEGIYDGELYNHEYKNNFEHIVHLARQTTPAPDCTDIQYHIYDWVTPDPFELRKQKLHLAHVEASESCYEGVEYLWLAKSVKCDDEAAVAAEYARAKADGYEGVMLRNAQGLYVHKRSNDLVKMKEMQDAEFRIIAAQEGRGRLQGHVGSFLCETLTGDTFSCKLMGETGYLKTLWENEELWKGKQLTVQFQENTSYGIPRFPVGKCIRDYE